MEHLPKYRFSMKIDGIDEATMYKTFPLTLSQKVKIWFKTLPQTPLTVLGYFTKFFATHYTAFIKKNKGSRTLKPGHKAWTSNNTNYIFKASTTNLTIAQPGALIVYRITLSKDTPLYKSLINSRPKKIIKVLVKVNKYIWLDEGLEE